MVALFTFVAIVSMVTNVTIDCLVIINNVVTTFANILMVTSITNFKNDYCLLLLGGHP